MASVSERFWSKVNKTDTCWLWTAGRNGQGYGVFCVSKGKFTPAHQFARGGTSPASSRKLRNQCGNNHCVNPDHWKQSSSAKPKAARPKAERDLARFMARIKKVMRVPSLGRGACWEWQKYVDPNGYGRFMGTYAHIFSYRAHRGAVPDGLELDHLCRNPCCANPNHLEAVTHRENCARSPIHPFFNAEVRAKYLIPALKKTHCKRGHELTPENRGTRDRCMVCARMHARNHYQNNLELERERSRVRHRLQRTKQEAA